MLTLSQLEQYLSKAAWILKGPVDAADFKVYIFPLLFFKRISDVYDEEYNEALKESEGDHDYASATEMHRFIIPIGCHWNDVRMAGQTRTSYLMNSYAVSLSIIPNTTSPTPMSSLMFLVVLTSI